MKSIISLAILATLLLISSTNVYAQNQDDIDLLAGMSLEELIDVTVVTASDKEETAAVAPANIHVITAAEIRERGYRTLQDVLQDLPGLTWSSPDGSWATQVIRGAFNTKRLKVLFNGVPFNPANGFGIIWAARFPVTGIERVEYIVGPYASLYGRNTFSGVLNIITRSGEELNGIEFNQMYGSYDHLQSSFIYGYGGQDDGFDIYLSLFGNMSAKGVDLVEEYPEDFALENRIGKTLFGQPVVLAPGVSDDFVMPWKHGDLYFRARHDSGFTLDVQANRATVPKIANTYTPLYYTSEKRTKMTDDILNISLRYDTELLEGVKSESSFTYQYYNWVALNTYINGTSRWYIQGSDSYKMTQNLRLSHGQSNELFVGFNFEHVDEKALHFSDFKPLRHDCMNTARDYTNILVQEEMQLTESFRMVAGLMYEHSNSYNGTFVPRMALIWQPNPDTIVKGLYATGHISPDPEVSVDQLLLDQLGTKGTTDIKPEYIHSLDININHMFNRRFTANLSVFHNRVTDMIQRVADNNLPPGFLHTWKNIGGSEMYGVDAGGNVLLMDNAKLFFSYSWVGGGYDQVDDRGRVTRIDRLPVVRNHHFKWGLTYALWQDKVKLYLHQLHYGTQNTWEERQVNAYQFAAQGYKLDGYDLFDLNISTTDVLSSQWYASLNIRNLFDEKGYDQPYFNYPVTMYSPIRLRYWSLQIGYKFN